MPIWYFYFTFYTDQIQRIEEGAYYEAHQQLRVVSQRYIKAHNYDAAIDILCSGAEALLKAGQGGSGCDLCLMLVEVYKSGSVVPSATSRGTLEVYPLYWHLLAAI